MSKNLLLILTLTVILVTAYFTIAVNLNNNKPLPKSEVETAINQAKHLYKQEKEKGRDFFNGSCLSDALMPNWVVDIAHNPRQKADDLPQNQCPGFVEGRSQHFVELDPEGNVMRAK